MANPFDEFERELHGLGTVEDVGFVDDRAFVEVSRGERDVHSAADALGLEKTGQLGVTRAAEAGAAPGNRILQFEARTPDPREVHQNRSQYAQRQDKARDAQLTTDPETYARAPDRYDFPGIDTGPTFREAHDDFDEDSFLDKFLGL